MNIYCDFRITANIGMVLKRRFAANSILMQVKNEQPKEEDGEDVFFYCRNTNYFHDISIDWRNGRFCTTEEF